MNNIIVNMKENILSFKLNKANNCFLINFREKKNRNKIPPNPNGP